MSTPLRPAVLAVQAVTLTAAFALLIYVIGLSWLWLLLGLLLAAPAVGAFWYCLPGNSGSATLDLDKFAQVGSLGGLLIIVSGGTADLWLQLLGGGQVDSSLHLLVLLLGVLLAVIHHLLQSQARGESRDSVSGLLEAGLRGPPVVPMLCLALVIGGAVLAYLYAVEQGPGLLAVLREKLLQRGIIPPITLSLFLWGMVLLAGKWLLTSRELRSQRADLGRDISGSTTNGRINGNIGSAYQLWRRGEAAQQSGQASSEATQDFASVLWQQFEAFYTLPRYISWAIPILGFIGTVLGISLAAEGLGVLLSDAGSDFSQSLGQALQPLGIAFDTTLIALSLSVLYTLCQTLLYRWEERQLLRLDEELRRHVR